jgi:chaperonin GroES
MTLSYTPRGDRVIVEQAQLPESPSEGLLVPKSQQKPLNEGTVIALGPKVYGLSVGQQVCFLEYAGSPIVIDGKEYVSMRDEEIHGVRNARNAHV